MAETVTYECDGSIAVIRMDDGRVNALSPELIAAVDRALDRAEQDGVPVVLMGRPGVLSAGFDLDVMRARGTEAWWMIMRGFRLAVRLLSHPQPVVVACTGHAIAMGSFLLLSADARVGTRGDYKVQANEVAQGMTLPFTALRLCAWRLSPTELHRATLLSHAYTPDEAVRAGFLDVVVDEDQLEGTARAVALECAALGSRAHRQSKHRARAPMLRQLRRTIWRDGLDLMWVGARSASLQLIRQGR